MSDDGAWLDMGKLEKDIVVAVDEVIVKATLPDGDVSNAVTLRLDVAMAIENTIEDFLQDWGISEDELRNFKPSLSVVRDDG